jgi:lipoprotein-releasing system ATP-binding protein
MRKFESLTDEVQPEADAGRVSTECTHLEVANLHKAFESPSGQRLQVLNGVSFSVNQRETVAVVGESGAGKSTLLQLIGGLEHPDDGSVALSVNSIPGERATRTGFVFQFHHLLSDLTAAENVALPLMIGRVSQREAMRRATQALERIGLAGQSSHPVGHLSGGEQQRVAVCRALIDQPLLVLADEPTGNLDIALGQEISKLLVSYARERPAIVVLATHNEGLARLCDRVLRLKAGKVEEL